MKHPVKPSTHGLVDYVFSAVQLAAPALLGTNKNAMKIFGATGSGLLLLNALTDTKYGLKRTVSFKDHQLVDKLLLSGLLRVLFLKSIRHNKKALWLAVGFFGAGLANYLLTDYNAGSRRTSFLENLRANFR